MRSLFLLFFAVISFFCHSANLAEFQFKLEKSKYFKAFNSIYVVGYTSTSNVSYLKIIKINEDLNTVSSDSVALNISSKDLHPLSFDTLHNFINLTCPFISNKNSCNVYRFDKSLKLIAKFESVPITQVNTAFAFDKEKYCYNNSIYVVRQIKDSVNKYYLDRYDIKDSTKLFEYKRVWQFYFSKNRFHNVHIIGVYNKLLWLYASIYSGSRMGQWVMAIDIKSSEVMCSYKVNAENIMEDFYYTNACYNPIYKGLTLSFYRVPKSYINYENKKVAFQGFKGKNLPIYLLTLDSMADKVMDLDAFLPTNSQMLNEKELKNFACKVLTLKTDSDKVYGLTEYVGQQKENTFKTAGFGLFKLAEQDYTYKLKGNFDNYFYRDAKFKEAKKLENIYFIDSTYFMHDIFYFNSNSQSIVLSDMQVREGSVSSTLITKSYNANLNQEDFYIHQFSFGKLSNKALQSFKKQQSANFILLSKRLISVSKTEDDNNVILKEVKM